MENKFTDIVRKNVMENWLNIEICTPQRYLINFNNDDLKSQLYLEVESVMLQIYYEYFNEFRETLDDKKEKDKKLKLFEEKISKSQFKRDFVDSFPEMNKYIKSRVKFFNKYINKLLKNLDIWCLDYNFRTLDNIKCFSGDSHNEGQYVCKIVIDSEKVFYYKPRSSELELRFSNFLSSLMDVENYVMYTEETFSIQKEITYISPKNIKDISKYYYNLGIIAAVFYFFNSADMHYENMIIHNDLPYFFDLETITAINHNYLSNEITIVKNFLNNSVLGSNIFPAPILSNGIDISVITGVDWKENGELNYAIDIQNDNTDNVKVEKKRSFLKKGNNEIKINGEKINPVEYIGDIIEGFTFVGKKVIANKEKVLDKLLFIIQNQKIRQIVRPTNTYAKFLKLSLEPYYLQSEAYRNSILKIFRKGVYKSCASLINYEIRNVRLGDIPLFFSDTNSRNLYDSQGNIIEEDFFSTSCEELIKYKVNNFTEVELDKQISLMKSSLYVACFNKYSSTNFPDITSKKELVQDYYQMCIDYYLTFFKEDNYLFNINVIGDGSKLALWLSDFSLYESGGILLLFYLKTELSLSSDFFYEITKTVFSLSTQIDKSLNAFNGLGSELYFLYTFFREESSLFYREKIIITLEEIEMKANDEITEFDYFNGIAGVLTVLSNMYKSMVSEQKNRDSDVETRVLNLIITFQNIFLKNHDEIKKNYQAGLAHGLAGIYYSLGLSYYCNEDVRVKDMCDSLIEQEEKYYLEINNDYLDPRDQSVGHFYLCYGIVGILLVRIELYRKGFLEKSTIINKVNRILDHFKNGVEFSTMNYSLCHGIASIIELIVSIQLISEREDDCREILEILIEEELNNFRNGYGNKVNIDSFMNGKLGKIYALLRTRILNLPSFPLLKFSAD